MAFYLISGGLGFGAIAGVITSKIISFFTYIDFDSTLVFVAAGTMIGGTLGYSIAYATGLISIPTLNNDDLLQQRLCHDQAVRQYNREMENYRIGYRGYAPTFSGSIF